MDITAPDVEDLGVFVDNRHVYQKRFHSLTFGDISVTNPIIDILPNALSENRVTGEHFIDGRAIPEVIIGMNVLRKLHIYIAMKEQKLFITPAAKVAAHRP